MHILLAGLSHKTAPVELREKMALNGKTLEEAYRCLCEREPIEGVVFLSTCNRTEIYATTRDVEAGLAVLQEYISNKLEVDAGELGSALYQPNCYDAISHLFRVASGLDSMVLGETQILGQVKEAYLYAVEYGASDAVLNALFQRAIYVGKKVRAETGLDRHATSVSYTAVELAKRIFSSLRGRTVLVIGAGEMSELAVSYLVEQGVETVVVSNRSFDRACSLAGRFGGSALKFDDIPEAIARADIVISCTAASHYVLRAEDMAEQLSRRGRSLLMIDLAVPRDIDPALGLLECVHLYDIDDLQNVIGANMMERQRAAREADKIVLEEIADFKEWMATLYVVPVIKALKTRGEAIKESEIRRALNRLNHAGPRETRIISSMASSIVNQILREPVENLKACATSSQGHLYAEVVKKLFGLEVGEKDYEDADGGYKGQ